MYRFSHASEVRFRDIDLLGHVNNAVYLTYLEQARMLYLLELGLRQQPSSTILVRNEIDYRRAVYLGDALEVNVRVSRIGQKSLDFAYEVYANGTLCAVASSVHVWFDFAAQLSVVVPAEARAAIAAFEGRSFDDL